MLENKNNAKSSEDHIGKVLKELVRQTEVRCPFNVWSVMQSVGISDLKNKPKHKKTL